MVGGDVLTSITVGHVLYEDFNSVRVTMRETGLFITNN